MRCKFCYTRLSKTVIPEFCVPKNDVASDQAVRGFKFRLLKTELNKATENKANQKELTVVAITVSGSE